MAQSSSIDPWSNRPALSIMLAFEQTPSPLRLPFALSYDFDTSLASSYTNTRSSSIGELRFYVRSFCGQRAIDYDWST